MKEKVIYALGFFDGVHLGHQALLSACRKLASENRCAAGAVTFTGHPDALVLGVTPELLNTGADRDRLLRQFSLETILSLPFDRKLMGMPWRDFLDLLVNTHCAAGLVCGSDFRFGYRGEGTAELLRQYCEDANMPCAIVPQQELDGVRISSTHIRRLIAEGEMQTAIRFLGHPHILTGTVMPGKQLGRTIDIPTANLPLPHGVLTPKLGVYACAVEIDGKTYAAVTNVGTRPTVDGTGITVEPWILDFEGDLYGRELTLAFHEFLRPEQKFPDLESLKAQIRRDAAKTRELLG